MIEVTLPRLAGTRDGVRALLDAAGVPVRLHGQAVVVYCRDLVSGSSSYADELVRQVLDVRGAGEILLVGSPQLFSQRVATAAARLGRSASLHSRSAAELPVARG